MRDPNQDLDWLSLELLEEEDEPQDQSGFEFEDDLLDAELYALLREDPVPEEEYDDEPEDYDGYADDEEEPAEDAPRRDRTIIGLMITASILCAGIVGMLVYWLAEFVR